MNYRLDSRRRTGPASGSRAASPPTRPRSSVRCSTPPGPVVSQAAVIAMAEGAARLFAADLSVALTGVAGPHEQDRQPPGTVWFALHHPGATRAQLRRLSGGPEDLVDSTCSHAIDPTIKDLEGTHGVG